MASISLVAVPMNGGDGVYSYACNSTFQREAMESIKTIIHESIVEKLDVNSFLTFSTSFNIADLGCSVGPNTFIAVQNIIESVTLKYKSQNLNPISDIEYHVFFNDQTFNDFNTLFKSLPLDRQYFAAGVPGFFHGRLFPKESLHFVHCSYALQWMSKVPNEVVEESSPAYNKGRIYYTNAPNEVFEAYSSQYAKDIQNFLDARREEIVCGGLVALIVPCIPDGIAPSDCPLIAVADVLGACLMDMVNAGLVSETKVDSFNFPKYNPSPKELKNLIETNGSFDIERMERLARDTARATTPTVQMLVLHLRAAWEGLIKKHFGSEIIDQLFNRVAEKFDTSSPLSLSNSNNNIFELFLLLKRKYN